MKKISVLLFSMAMCLCVSACGGQESSNETTIEQETKTDTQDAIESGEAENSSSSDSKSEDDLLTKSELNLYGTIQDSNYLSVILYDPALAYEEADDYHENAIVAVYDMGDNMKSCIEEEYQVMLGGDNVYCFAIGSQKRVVSCVISTGGFSDGVVRAFDVEYNEEYGLPVSTDYRSVALSSLDKEYKNEERYIYTEKWEVLNSEELQNIQVYVGETDEERKGIYMYLEESVHNDESAVKKINQMIADSQYKQTVVELATLEDLQSVEKTYGTPVNLSETIFYQDIIATKISNDYGLNLRGTQEVVHVDQSYIGYKMADLERQKVVEVHFDYVNWNNISSYPDIETNYDVYKKNFDMESFIYTDADGNEYAYFGELQYLYVFKNKEFVGVIKTYSEEPFADVNALFGIKK